jgi:hypothetical protein
MKFPVIRLACCLSRQQTLCRAIAVASRIVHGILHSPPTCFGVESPLRWWLDPGEDALIDRRRLYKIAHQASSQSRWPTTTRRVSEVPLSKMERITSKQCRIIEEPTALRTFGSLKRLQGRVRLRLPGMDDPRVPKQISSTRVPEKPSMIIRMNDTKGKRPHPSF